MHILFRVAIAGSDHGTPQIKYVHTQTHSIDAEIAAKPAILDVFRATNQSYSQYGLNLFYGPLIQLAEALGS